MNNFVYKTLSASLGQVATRNQTRKELVQLAVMHFLKYLEDNHPMEVVGLVALGPTDVGQPLAVPLTRDYGDIRKALYSIELCASDATDADAGLTEALRQIYVRFGADMAPTQVIFITDALHHSADASDGKVDMELPSSVKLHVVALGSGRPQVERLGDGASELRKRQKTAAAGDGQNQNQQGSGMLRKYQKLATLQGGGFHLIEPPHSAPQLKQAFDSLARTHYGLYDGQLTLGHFARRITLYPNPNLSFFQHNIVHTELPRSFPGLLPLIGFMAAAKLPSPPSLSTHAIIPLPSQASLDQGLGITEDDLALCLMLNACLKSEKKVGVVQLGHRWFGLISSMNEGTTDCLVLHVLSPKLPLYDLMAWTESTPPALISTMAPPYSPFATAFPIKKQTTHAKSYAIGKGVYSIPSISPDVLQSDCQKVLRCVAGLPQKKDLLYSECQKMRQTAHTYHFPDLVERLIGLLEEELGGQKEKSEGVLIVRDIVHQLRNNAPHEALTPRDSYKHQRNPSTPPSSSSSSSSSSSTPKKSAMSLANLLN